MNKRKRKQNKKKSKQTRRSSAAIENYRIFPSLHHVLIVLVRRVWNSLFFLAVEIKLR